MLYELNWVWIVKNLRKNYLFWTLNKEEDQSFELFDLCFTVCSFYAVSAQTNCSKMLVRWLWRNCKILKPNNWDTKSHWLPLSSSSSTNVYANYWRYIVVMHIMPYTSNPRMFHHVSWWQEYSEKLYYRILNNEVCFLLDLHI